MDELNAGLKAGKPVRMEYVVLGEASVATVRRTRGRYFGGECEVAIPTESYCIASWSDKLHWTPEEKISAASWAFASALSNS